MQAETNTKIAIRGKGSVKEGASRDIKYDYGEDEPLHVLITGDNQPDVDRASAMIERMCTPMDDAHNEHKRLQLRELAALNGTLKDEEMQLMLAEQANPLDVYKLPSELQAKVQEQYDRDVARVRGGPVVRSDEEYRKFLAELGGAPPPEMMGLDTGGEGFAPDGRRHPPMPDECKIFVGNLPAAYDTNMLRALFDPVAEAAGSKVVHAAVITEPGSGVSRGFGFVHIPDGIAAKAARDAMDGHQVRAPPATAGRLQHLQHLQQHG
ncbi:MAG: hypothetical protein J3K34DRAFT_386945 [Monoraphidium minutum]|nr:MAG: hypothetical protein J3K34DRAFT_386945 [Monoraphidium minutum]